MKLDNAVGTTGPLLPDTPFLSLRFTVLSQDGD